MDITSTIKPDGEIPQVMFSWVDYLIFAFMLTLSVIIGVYHGYCSTKQNTANEYLLGGKTMRIFPVSMSLIASYTSAIAPLAVPADVYSFGAALVWICLPTVISSVISVYVLLPVLFKLQGSSIYEYLQLRFDNRIRILASFLSTLAIILYTPIIIYLPSLAFSQATGSNLHLITPVLSIICIFYTAVGGLKAVIWTDTIQTVAIGFSILVVLVLGISSAGGFSNIWIKSIEGHRLEVFNFTVDPTRRDSFWGMIIGGTAQLLYELYLNQGSYQRFVAVPSIYHARKVIVIFCVGVIAIHSFACFTGLILFAKYSECDPLSTKQVLRNDQLLPYYIMDVAASIPGIPGLFIAGIASAGLSTLSTQLNSLSCTIYEDFVAPVLPSNISQTKARNIMKLIIVLIGAISTALVFVVERLGGMLPLIVSVGGISSGPVVGLFCLGILFPCANSRGALIGGIAGLLFNSWMIIGNQLYQLWGLVEDFSKPSSTESCNFYVNRTFKVTTSSSEPVFLLYRITFWYYNLFGVIVVIVIGLVVSWFTNKDVEVVHPELISPIMHCLLSKNYKAVSVFKRSQHLQVDTTLQ